MRAIDILSDWIFEGEVHPFIVQMFVEVDNRFNYTFFNKYFETKFTHAEINNAIEELTGSKVIKFRDLSFDDVIFMDFQLLYEFGKFENAREWIDYIYKDHGEVLPRSVVLNWIAKQHPPKQQSSFLPVNDRNMYVKEEKEEAA